MTRIHSTAGGNSKFSFKNTSFSTSIFELVRGFLKKIRDDLTSTSVKVVPLVVTSVFTESISKKKIFLASKILELPTVRFAHMRF